MFYISKIEPQTSCYKVTRTNGEGSETVDYIGKEQFEKELNLMKGAFLSGEKVVVEDENIERYVSKYELKDFERKVIEPMKKQIEELKESASYSRQLIDNLKK
jgi:hypothetical protein